MLSPSNRVHTLTCPLFVANIDGVGTDDLVGHDSDDGKVHIDSGALGTTDSSSLANGGCTSPYQRLKIGDGEDDPICHDEVSGNCWIDHADDGQCGSIDWPSPPGSEWCQGAREGLH